MRIHLATGNAHKLREFAALARGGRPEPELVAPAAMPLVAEDTGTFAGNARKKATALKALLPPEAWVLADDSGLCVDALGGAPGVESAYYAGPAGDGAANLAKLVRTMRGVPEEKRGAHFICVLVLLAGSSEAEHVFEGRCAGRLQSAPAGGAGFGYDPLFVPAGGTATYAQLGDAFKNTFSHRALAWRQLAQWLSGGPAAPA